MVAMLLASIKVVAIQDASSSLSLDCGRRINIGYNVLACYSDGWLDSLAIALE